MGALSQNALSEEWLGRTDTAFAFYKDLRDRYMPGAPIWLNETAQASCGGDKWAASFLDTFRYVDQMGRLARQGVAVIMHNTLAASDYGLIDEETVKPRPNYWGSATVAAADGGGRARRRPAEARSAYLRPLPAKVAGVG